MPKLDSQSDFHFIEADEPEVALDHIINLITTTIPSQFNLCPIKDIQLLCPMSRGTVGTRNLNLELQKVLNPPTPQSIQRFGFIYSVGDKVMQITNNYDKDVYNGDIGIVSSLNHEDEEITICFDGREVVYDFGELDEVVLSYATTIHKSQGSEYSCVVIPILMQHYMMLQRNLIYTAITRGKKLVVLVGQKKALFIAVKKEETLKRWSTLKKRLLETFEKIQLPSP